MSSGAVDLLEKMLVFDPNKRITGMKKDFRPPSSTILSILYLICFCLQLRRHFVTPIYNLFMISTMNLSAPGLSTLISSIHHALKITLESWSGGSLQSSIQTQPIRSICFAYAVEIHTEQTSFAPNTMYFRNPSLEWLGLGKTLKFIFLYLKAGVR